MPGISISSTEKRSIKFFFLFFILSLSLYLPSAFLRELFPPDELRNLYIASSLRNPKDFLLPTFAGETYYQKPPLYFWILNILLKFSKNNFLPVCVALNVIISTFILFFNYLFFKKRNLERLGIYSSLMLSILTVFYALNIIVRMDILFFFLLYLSLLFFYQGCEKGSRRYLFFSSLFCFLSVFTKGGFGFFIPLFTESIFIIKERKYLKYFLTTTILSSFFIISWLFSFSLVDRNYLKTMLFRQTFSRAFSPFSHGEPCWYYFPFFLVLYLPWTYLLGGYIFGKLKDRKFFLWERFYLIWFIAGFVLLSIVGSKLSIYLITISLPFSVLTGIIITDKRFENAKRVIFYLTAGSLIGASLFALIHFQNKNLPPGIIYVELLIVMFSLLLIKKNSLYQFKVIFIMWLVIYQIMNFLYVPLASRYSKSKSSAEKMTIKSYKK